MIEGKSKSLYGWIAIAFIVTVGVGAEHFWSTSVLPFYRWEEWPDPYSHGGGVASPSVTNTFQRGSEEALFLDKVRKTMIEADEIAIGMVYALHRQAEEGVRGYARPDSRRAEDRLWDLRNRLAFMPYPTQCVQVVVAVTNSLTKTERFYRSASQNGRGAPARALEQARRAHRYQEEVCACFSVTPYASDALIHAIVTNDCLALAIAVNDCHHQYLQISVDDWFAGNKEEWSEEMTAAQKFYQANHEKPFLRALWLLLDGEEYSPFLASAFLCWRSEVQASYFGVSEWSEIPNEYYNRVRFKALSRVSEFLREHPDNLHAQAQQEVLLGVPNIRRGTPYGNTCLYRGIWL